MRVDVLPKQQQVEFDKPAVLISIQRRIVFKLPPLLQSYIHNSLESPTSIVGFILQYGYFNVSGKFFYVSDFPKEDILAVCKWYEIDCDLINWSNYQKSIYYHHQKNILDHFGIQRLSEEKKMLLEKEAKRLFKKKNRQSVVFWILVEYIKEHRIEVPRYRTLAIIIIRSFKNINEGYLSIITESLTPQIEKLLDNLFKKNEELNTYNLTILKNPLEKTKLKAIRKNTANHEKIKKIYHQIEPIVLQLDLSSEMIEYYAQFVIRSQVFQVSRRENRYLLVVCFIIFQYYHFCDLLCSTLLSASKETENSIIRQIKNVIIDTQFSNQNNLDNVLSSIKEISLESSKLIKEKRYASYETQLIKLIELLPEIEKLDKQIIKKKPLYYKILEENSRKLQLRTSEILKNIDFQISNASLEKAVSTFKLKEGTIAENDMEFDFLSIEERKNLTISTSKISLYKALLIKHISQGIKSGEVSTLSSFEYKPFDNYLIKNQQWKDNKENILNDTNLKDKLNWIVVKNNLKISLQEAFDKTYPNIDSPENVFVPKKDKNDKPRFITPSNEKSATIFNSKILFPPESSISILEILNTIDHRVKFTESFTHWSDKSIPKKPSSMELFAIIMAYGCNIGVNNMAKNTTNINSNNLNNTANWYFSLDNIQKANDRVIAYTNELKITKLLQARQKKIHTSSDGQKFYVDTDSIHANYSYKYFGKNKGIVMYSFIDNLHRLFYSTAFSSSEREALYVLDGLLHNEIIKTDLHSTDTHGYTEMVFALTYLLDVEFAPRIANFQENQLFIFDGIIVPNLENCKIDIKKINTIKIDEQWDTILKIASTLKSKHATSSTLFKRLNSYARQNETYQALRDLGRLVRTKFLLNYMDDPFLRQMIQQQLNKGESSNQLARHIFYGNNGHIKYATKQEQLQATACKTLIHNLILCWNYMYLSKQIFKAPNKKEIFEQINQSSPIHWEHINFYGIFDFSIDALKNVYTLIQKNYLTLK